MPAGRRDGQREDRLLAAVNLGEVRLGRGADGCSRDVAVAVAARYLLEMGDGLRRDRREVLRKGRARVEEHALAAARAVLGGGGEHAGKRADISAQGQRAVDDDVGDLIGGYLPGGGQNGGRDRERDGGRRLPQRRGRDVDRDAAFREPVAAVEDAGAHGFAKLAVGASVRPTTVNDGSPGRTSHSTVTRRASTPCRTYVAQRASMEVMSSWRCGCRAARMTATVVRCE